MIKEWDGAEGTDENKRVEKWKGRRVKRRETRREGKGHWGERRARKEWGKRFTVCGEGLCFVKIFDHSTAALAGEGRGDGK